MLTATADGLLHDGGRVFGPDERGRMAVPVGDVSLDVANQRTDGIERAAPDRLTRQNADQGLTMLSQDPAFGVEGNSTLGCFAGQAGAACVGWGGGVAGAAGRLRPREGRARALQ